ncbi:MAG: hypothetical protein KAV87_12280 [Desulfobacteraceae bacterium]|nr:hypothetical protein [Desulfobacteraceae bacterium]
MNNKIREFYEKCSECSFEGTIEEKRDYNGELLAVSVCPVCHFYDWMLPKDWDEEDNETLDLTEKWAKGESQKMLKEHDLFYKIEFSEPAKQLLIDLGLMVKIKKPIMKLCDLFNIHYAYVNQYRKGIKISLGS